MKTGRMSDAGTTPRDLIQFRDDNSYNQARDRKNVHSSQMVAASQEVASMQEQSILDQPELLQMIQDDDASEMNIQSNINNSYEAIHQQRLSSAPGVLETEQVQSMSHFGAGSRRRIDNQSQAPPVEQNHRESIDEPQSDGHHPHLPSEEADDSAQLKDIPAQHATEEEAM